MHQLCRLYVNRSIIINYSYSLCIPVSRRSSRVVLFSPCLIGSVLFDLPRFSSLFIFFAMRFAYRAAERLFQGKVLP